MLFIKNIKNIAKKIKTAVLRLFGRLPFEERFRSAGQSIVSEVSKATPGEGLAEHWKFNVVRSDEGISVTVTNKRITAISREKSINLLDIFEYGRKSYWIEAVNRRVLRFQWKARGNKVFFRRKVFIPAMEAALTRTVAAEALREEASRMKRTLKGDIRTSWK